MADCISSNFKMMILRQLSQKKDPGLMAMFIEEFMPTCEDMGQTGGAATATAVAAVKEAKKRMATLWPAAVYIDENGVRHDEGMSASALYEKLTGKKPSGSICNDEGNKCTPASLIDSYRFWGYHVQGNGEPAPITDPEKSVAQTVKETEVWKEHLKNSGMKFVVIHPEWIKKSAAPE